MPFAGYRQLRHQAQEVGGRAPQAKYVTRDYPAPVPHNGGPDNEAALKPILFAVRCQMSPLS